MNQMLLFAGSCLLFSTASHSEEGACVQADPATTEAFTALAKQQAALSMKVSSQDVLVFRVLDCGGKVDVAAFQRNRLINWEFIFDRQTKKLLEVKSEDG